MVSKKTDSSKKELVKKPKAKLVKKADAKPAKKTSKKVSKTKITTMDELFKKKGDSIVVPKKGVAIKGKITKIAKKAMTVDIGAKTDGLVADKEFELAQELISKLKVGDEIEAMVFSTENDRGHILLSLKRAAVDAKWEFFKNAHKTQEEIAVKGLDVNKGGLIVGTHGVRGFVPSSQFSRQLLGKLHTLRNKNLQVKVIEVDQQKNRLIFSERHVSEAGELEQKEKALETVKQGEVYSGVVSGVMPFGLFVTVEVELSDKKDNLAQVEGLVHISEISWEKVEDPRDYNKVGDKIKVKVLGTDEQTGKLNLSIKQLSDDPWLSIEERYPVGTTFTGKVSRTESFGVFINVEPGVDGLMHQTKIERGKVYEKGEKVTVNVESIASKERRMSLSPVLTEVPVDYK
ncbi:MAG: S1 RNA-binding domain-containing protein [Patescibacteria group bacterium]